MEIAAMSEDYTIVLTSCRRFDLLRVTLASLFDSLDLAPARVIVIEDSAEQGIEAAVSGLKYPVEILVNSPQLGQMKSIDKAYSVVDTPYIFHCEDDWRFTRSGFLAQSLAILKARPDASMVGLRPRHELNPLVRNMAKDTVEGAPCFALDPSLHPEYFSHSFNPGLRRHADYMRLGPYAPIGREEDVSYHFKKAGFRIYNLEEPAVEHIGDGRHIDDPTQPKRAKGFVRKLFRSLKKRMKRVRRSLGGA
jgi:hypothetical protein